MKLIVALKADQIALGNEKLKKLNNTLHRSKFIYRYIPRENWHIKLLALNDVRKEDLKELLQKINAIVKEHKEFDLKLNGLWAWPNQEEGRVLWIGVQNSIALRSLQEALTNSVLLVKDRWDDKIFKPTLPVLRFKNHHHLSDMISPYKTADFGKQNFRKVAVYEMTSAGAFPQYKILSEFNLQEKENTHLANLG